MIAPVQAFILKQLLLEDEPDTWQSTDTNKQDRLLVRAATDIIQQAARADRPLYHIVYPETPYVSAAGTTTATTTTASCENGQEEEEEAGEEETVANDEESMERELLRRLDPDFFHSRLR